MQKGSKRGLLNTPSGQLAGGKSQQIKILKFLELIKIPQISFLCMRAKEMNLFSCCV
jgi:hypothetical protein